MVIKRATKKPPVKVTKRVLRHGKREKAVQAATDTVIDLYGGAIKELANR